MKLLFTASQLPLSKAIRTVTGEPCSHCAIDFGSVVAQSNLLGVGLEYGPFFVKSVEVIHTLERVTPDQAADNAHFASIMGTEQNSYYDVLALLFCALAMLASKYLKTPMPKKNLWRVSGTYLCTDLAQQFAGVADNTMITPEGLYQQLKASGQWKDAT